MTTYKVWTQGRNIKYDFDVVKYYPKYDASRGESVHIGDRLGYAGFNEVKNGGDSKLDGNSLRGYPGDKTTGSMWSSGSCTHWCFRSSWYGCRDDELSRHNCDTLRGMSGSAVMSSSGYIYGVHVGHNNDSNRAVVLHDQHYDNLKA